MSTNRPADGAPSPQELDIEMLRQMVRRSFAGYGGYVREDALNALDRIGSSLRAVERERDALEALARRALLRVSLDEPVAYVGCYVLKWGKLDEPEYGFREVHDGDIARALSPGAATTESEGTHG